MAPSLLFEAWDGGEEGQHSGAVGGSWQWPGGPGGEALPQSFTLSSNHCSGEKGLWLRDLGPIWRISAPGPTIALRRWRSKYTRRALLQCPTQHPAECGFTHTITCIAVYTFRCTHRQIHVNSCPHCATDTPGHSTDAELGAFGVL